MGCTVSSFLLPGSVSTVLGGCCSVTLTLVVTIQTGSSQAHWKEVAIVTEWTIHVKEIPVNWVSFVPLFVDWEPQDITYLISSTHIVETEQRSEHLAEEYCLFDWRPGFDLSRSMCPCVYGSFLRSFILSHWTLSVATHHKDKGNGVVFQKLLIAF